MKMVSINSPQKTELVSYFVVLDDLVSLQVFLLSIKETRSKKHKKYSSWKITILAEYLFDYSRGIESDEMWEKKYSDWFASKKESNVSFFLRGGEEAGGQCEH